MAMKLAMALMSIAGAIDGAQLGNASAPHKDIFFDENVSTGRVRKAKGLFFNGHEWIL